MSVLQKAMLMLGVAILMLKTEDGQSLVTTA